MINETEKNLLKTKRKQKMGEAIFITSLLIIPILHWLIFWLYVNISSISLAFLHPRTGEVTFSNFQLLWDRLISPANDSLGISIVNTMYYFFENILLILPGALIISFFIYKKIFAYRVFRIIFYLPAVISGVIMTTCFSVFISPDGPLGQLVKLFGTSIPPEGLLGRDSTATPTILLYNLWTGFTTNIILLSGAMARIPIEVIEAAKLEGCGPFKEIVYLIFPLIWSTLSTLIILGLTGLFTASGPILLFTGGNFKTSTISYWIFAEVYGSGAVGGSGTYNLVSCAGLCFTLIGFPIIMFFKYLIEKIEVASY